jgi:hypothetical protein
MHALLEMIEEKQRLVGLLNAHIDGTGLTVVIGAEHLEPPCDRSALWPVPSRTAPVPNGRRHRSHLACATRAIAVVDGAAQAITRVLRDPD